MTERRPPLTVEVARSTWDHAAASYTHLQDSGGDYYRYEFFGPAQIELCGEVAGLRVLDIGCGNGYLSRELARRGASVTGVDLSEEMIRLAEERDAVEPLGIRYVVLDAAEVDQHFTVGEFDLVTACLALQDMPDIPAVLGAVRRVLKGGGRFISSGVHPASDTPIREWVYDEQGEKRALAVAGYFEDVTLEFEWNDPERMLYPFHTQARHVPLERWFAWMLGTGFSVRGFHEPQPTAEAVAARPDLADASIVPYFVIFDLEAGRTR